MAIKVQHPGSISRICVRSARAVLALAVVLFPMVVATKTATAQTFKVLYSFAGGAGDGYRPYAGLIRDAAGNLYGSTRNGGEGGCNAGFDSGCGIVFKLNRTGKEIVLYRFTGGADGGMPEAGLIRDANGDLYGTTADGGQTTDGCASRGGCGVVFKLSKSRKETVLYSFTGATDGTSPSSGLVRDAKGSFYGTAGGGAFNSGVVFKLTPTGKFAVPYSFTGGTDGGTPLGGLIRDKAGNFYGTTTQGGLTNPNCPGFGCGVVFKLNAAGKETVLYSFTGKADGAAPVAGLIRDGKGNFYGTASAGGDSCSCGVVFKLTPAGKFTVLYSFTGGADGRFPVGELVLDAHGVLYGIANEGGSSSVGTAFKLTPTGKFILLHTFTAGNDGGAPFAGLLRDAAGNLYGTTGYGGNSGCGGQSCGVVFELTP